jgi:hypothetical protein
VPSQFPPRDAVQAPEGIPARADKVKPICTLFHDELYLAVLHKGDLGPCVEQMHRDRVAQRMKAPFLRRDPCQLPLCLHQVPVGPPLQGQATIGDEERGGAVLTGPQVRTKPP